MILCVGIAVCDVLVKPVSEETLARDTTRADFVRLLGGGDAFTGGLLYGILQGWEPEKWVRFGWATGVLAVSSLNDYAEPADEKQVWDIYAGNARVQR